jgi:hypothetical protein
MQFSELLGVRTVIHPLSDLSNQSFHKFELLVYREQILSSYLMEDGLDLLGVA